MKIIEWIMQAGLAVLQWYVVYVLVAACAFGAWLWHTVWHHDTVIKGHDVSHHRAD